MIARDLRHHLCAGKDIALTCASLLRPREQMLPSQFASRYRYLKEGTTERPGLWSNDHFPYLVDVMDAALEAIQAGKNLVLMKSAQGGGSEAIINVCCFLLEYFPGPLLYLISKDELAAEFGRERVGHIVDTCEPLKRKAIRGKGKGDLIKTKRFADGKWSIMGSGSVLNLQSLPYRIVVIDEYDSMLDEMEGHGDPLKLAEARTGAFSGRTLVIVFAHPSTRERGAGKIYYEESDQRRGHVKCPHCGNEFWLSWSNFRCIPKEGMTKSQAERDPNCYQYFAPCCGVEISDGQRWMMARNVRQKSVLAPAVAKEKKWIGVHFGKQYMPHKTTAQLIAEDIESQGDSGKRRVFVNKTMGDVYEAAIQETDAAQWRRLKVLPRHDKDNEFYVRGQVPSGVRFLTAGQDSRSTELHWAIWGWGLLPDESNYPILCRWLIDYGVVKRTYSLTLDAAELRVFDQILYERSFPSVCGKYQFWVEQGFHDSSWQPVAVYQYCRLHPFRAFPIKGGSVEGGRDVESKAPRLRWGAPPGLSNQRRGGKGRKPEARNY